MQEEKSEGIYKLDITVRRVRDGATPTLASPSAVADCFAELASRDREVFVVACVDARKQLIAWQEAFVGTLDAVAAHPREILRAALLTMAAGIIIVHNHPSGLADPSEEDLVFTRRLAAACDLISVPLVDSVIIGANGTYWSWISDGDGTDRNA